MKVEFFSAVTSTTPPATSLAIGDEVGSGTSGSILFLDASSLLAQDNDNLFWDDGNSRLGIGTNAPTNTLTIAGGSGDNSIQLRSVSSPDSTLTFTTSATGVTMDTAEDFIASIARNHEVRICNNDLAGVFQIFDGEEIGSTDVPILSVKGSTGGLIIGRSTGFADNPSNAPTNGICCEGNVGIGVVSPSAKLDIVGSDSLFATTAFRLQNSSNEVLIQVRNDGSFAIGKDAGCIDTSNIAIGSEALTSCTGTNNVAIGFNAGINTSTGLNNVVIGFQAGQGTIYRENVIIGSGAGAIGTSLRDCVILGASCNTTGTGNRGGIFIGKGIEPISASSVFELNIGNSIRGTLANSTSAEGNIIFKCPASIPADADFNENEICFYYIDNTGTDEFWVKYRDNNGTPTFVTFQLA